MPHRTAPLRLAPLTLLSLLGCAGAGLDAFDDTFCRRATLAPGATEAGDWLRTPDATPRHFGNLTGEESLALADALETAGAVRLTVVAGPPRGLVIELPADSARRLAVFRLFARAVRGAGFEPGADRGQAFAFLPWPD